MRKFIRLALLTSIAATPAGADTLREALIRAYADNPTITGQRAALRATDENVPIARSQGLPGVNLTGGFSENALQVSNSPLSPDRSLNAVTALSIPLYTGGAVRNGVLAAETRVDAGRALLRGTEANLFTNVVGAYMNVIRDEAIVGLNTQNVRVLETNLTASRDRFQVGDVTRTDVAQSEARLALSRAQLQAAQAQLISSRENYINVVGAPPGLLEEPPALPNLPASPADAVARALEGNPQIIAARRQRDAARLDVNVARAARLPRVSVVTQGAYANYLGSLPGTLAGTAVPNTQTTGTVGLSLGIPLFQGGRPAAQVRQAQALESQAIETTTGTERAVIAQARSAYAVFRSSQQVIASAETAVAANRLSLEGVRAENSVGTRTILDILNAEQELLNSQVTLVTARRDSYVAGFALLAAMGDAEARDLNLDGGTLYDPTINYNRVRNRISDWGSDPAPVAVAPSTAATPAQDATVSRPLDPALQSDVNRTPALTTGAETPSRR